MKRNTNRRGILTREKAMDYSICRTYTGGQDINRPTRTRAHEIRYKGMAIATRRTQKEAMELIKHLIEGAI